MIFALAICGSSESATGRSSIILIKAPQSVCGGQRLLARDIETILCLLTELIGYSPARRTGPLLQRFDASDLQRHRYRPARSRSRPTLVTPSQGLGKIGVVNKVGFRCRADILKVGQGGYVPI